VATGYGGLRLHPAVGEGCRRWRGTGRCYGAGDEEKCSAKVEGRLCLHPAHARGRAPGRGAGCGRRAARRPIPRRRRRAHPRELGARQLPAQLFPTTGIPVCVLVFDRARDAGGAREHERDVLFIDASRDFAAGKKQNQLRDEDVAKIVRVARGREEIDRYSHRATFEKIEHNKFNLNIPRYVDTFEPEPEIDVQAVQNEIRELDRQLAETRAQMNRYLQELGIEI
jgi:hypothetical protein